MKLEIKKLEKEKETLQERIRKIDKVIDAFQDVCNHKKDDGRDAWPKIPYRINMI